MCSMRQGRGSRATEYRAHKCELSVMLARLSPVRLPVIRLPTPFANTIPIAPPIFCVSTGFHQQIDAMQPANSGRFFSCMCVGYYPHVGAMNLANKRAINLLHLCRDFRIVQHPRVYFHNCASIHNDCSGVRIVTGDRTVTMSLRSAMLQFLIFGWFPVSI